MNFFERFKFHYTEKRITLKSFAHQSCNIDVILSEAVYFDIRVT